MNGCRDQLDRRWHDGRAACWAGVDLLGSDEDGVATELVDTQTRISAITQLARLSPPAT